MTNETYALAGAAGADVAAAIRQRVREQTRLTCSCGVAPNQCLAKICADINKPDGQYILSSDIGEITRFMESLPIRKVPGIGKVSHGRVNFGWHRLGTQRFWSATADHIAASYCEKSIRRVSQ